LGRTLFFDHRFDEGQENGSAFEPPDQEFHQPVALGERDRNWNQKKMKN
jgi:hypothetical protein